MLSLRGKLVVWLNSFEGVYASKQLQLLSCFADEAAFDNEFCKSFEKVKHLLSEEQFMTMAGSLKNCGVDKALEQATCYGATVITIFSENYPRSLVNIPCPPTVLYCIGDTSLLNSKCVAVVGSRKSSLYGEKITKRFVKTLVANRVTIVSGLALGIDAAAHNAALENDGKTIAVLGGGFSKIYPPQHEQLFKTICEKGLVITEFAPLTPSQPFHFPLRNRIVSGLSDGVFMSEAGKKSGTFTTIGHALDQGRDVFIAPGELYSPHCEGSNEMLKTIPDALVICPEDIMERLNYTWIAQEKTGQAAPAQLSAEEKLIADFLSAGVRNFDDIVSRTKISPGILQSCLSKLEIEGIVEKQAGNFFKLL